MVSRVISRRIARLLPSHRSPFHQHMQRLQSERVRAPVEQKIQPPTQQSSSVAPPPQNFRLDLSRSPVELLFDLLPHKANEYLNRSGRFWMKDYFDRFIRNEEHYWNTVRYIENNPVKARLCKEHGDWPFSSAWFRRHGRKQK